MEEIHATKMELNRLMVVEEDMWYQRSRNCWLRSGERNTSFFHAKASNQHQRNAIHQIRDSKDTWQEDEGEIVRNFLEYFKQLFTSFQLNDSAKLIDAIHTKVIDRMNFRLLQKFHASEVELALKQMHPMKAPGPNGMPPYFTSIFGLL